MTASPAAPAASVTPTVAEAENLAARILAAAGAPPAAAGRVAASLVLAERMGHASHGLLRVLEYRNSTTNGEIDPTAVPEVVRRTGATAVVDGHWGWGHLAAQLATDTAAELALQQGAGVVAVRSCGHSGRLGEWVEELAAQGLLGIGWLSCGPAVAPLGGLDRQLGTNPLAIAVSGGPGDRPIVLDFATAGYAEGKVRVAARNGRPVPPGVLQTSDGRPTTDPNDFYSGGAILPFGGHKGHGLSIMLQIVADALCGGGPGDRPDSFNHLVLLAVAPESLTDSETYRARDPRHRQPAAQRSAGRCGSTGAAARRRRGAHPGRPATGEGAGHRVAVVGTRTPGSGERVGMSDYVIAVADTSFPDQESLRADFTEQAELRFVDLSHPDGIGRATKGADAVVVTLQRMSAEVIAAFDSSVRAIGRAGVGLDSIDLVAAGSHGVAVINQPAYAAPEVASHALAMLLVLQRRIVSSDKFVRDGWQGPLALTDIRPLDEMTVGVLGCGRIGSVFAEYARPLAASVSVYDPGLIQAPPFAVRVDSLDELLARSDVLSLHLPLTALTRNLLGRSELERLPAGAIVLNVARGGILDERALADLLVAGRLGGAGLDVYDSEPLPADSPLHSAPNTVLTPHSASVSRRSVHRLSRWSVADVIAYLDTGTVQFGSLVVDGSRPTVSS